MDSEKINYYLETYHHMVASRYTDHLQAEAAKRGEVFFYIPSSGHELTALFSHYLKPCDWLHLHYRDRALAYARGVTYETVFNGLFSRENSNSAGRRMPAFPCEKSLNIMSTPTLVGSNALQAVGVAHAINEQENNPIVLVSVGDGSTQQGDFYEAVAEAVRFDLRVVFLIEDNRYALSTPTKGNTFYSLPNSEINEFYGINIERINGTHVIEADEKISKCLKKSRNDNKPQIIVFNVERLESHTNADDQSVYRSKDDLSNSLKNLDPCANLRNVLIDNGVAIEVLNELEEKVQKQIDEAFKIARNGLPPKPTFTAKRPLDIQKPEHIFKNNQKDLTMLEAMRESLRHQLNISHNTILLGQDIEDPKGDVFGLTRTLSSNFPKRVRNSALAENTILGVSTGLALAGKKPIAFMQFSDFLPVAYNHLLSEIGAMYWRSNGQWNAPVTVMAIAGGYRPGLGPYHAQTLESICAHIPGIDVFMPSTAEDAAGLLNAISESNRPSLFLFPKSLINDRSRMTNSDISNHYVPIGKAKISRVGQDLTIVSWGSPMPLCEKVGEAFYEAGINIEVIDLRTIFPWDIDCVLNSVNKTKKLVVVHEDNQTCGMGAEIIAQITELTDSSIITKRITRPDTYIPYDYSAQIEVLPSFKKIMEVCSKMLNAEISWEKEDINKSGLLNVKAIGSSPSDETVNITELFVSVGDIVKDGQLLASVEADKASMEISSPASGKIEEIKVNEGDILTVGESLLTISTDQISKSKPVTEENPGVPKITKHRQSFEKSNVEVQRSPSTIDSIYISNITKVFGSKYLSNDEILPKDGGWDSEAIQKRTGIKNRYWINKNENVLTLAVSATKKLLKKEGLNISEIGAIICSTGTPLSMTPSLACRVLNELSPDKGEVLMQAHDVNAACSGYIYALQSAFDFISNAPNKKVIVITAETLSPMINKEDPKTYPLFGDAATATLVSSEVRSGSISVKLNRPVLSATGVDPKVLYVPNLGSNEFIEMEGLTVFKLAVRKMIDMLDQACAYRGISSKNLDFIVPHQANERIIEAIRKTIHCPAEKMFNHIEKYGNTSSNTIPIALEELLPSLESGNLIGLTAFGGGFTFGAAVIENL